MTIVLFVVLPSSTINKLKSLSSVQQYNVCNGTKPTTPIIDNTYHKDPPQQPHIPKINTVSFSSDTKEYDGKVPTPTLTSSSNSDDEQNDEDDDSVYVDAFNNETDMDEQLLDILENSISNDTNPTPNVAGFNHFPPISSNPSHSTDQLSNDQINPHISGLILPSSTNPIFNSSNLPLIDSTNERFELSL